MAIDDNTVFLMVPPKTSLLVTAISLVLIATLFGALLPTAAGAQSEEDRPNIVVIIVDDLDVELFENHRRDWPAISRLVNRGTSFSQAHVTASLCGPSRASLLSGQGVHRSAIRTNGNRWESGVPKSLIGADEVPTGGFDNYIDEGLHTADLPSVMSDLGYQTGLVGKYLHTGFPSPTLGPTWYPESWDQFHASMGDYWGFRQLNNGKLERPKGFRTDVEAAQAVETIKTFERSDDPWMLYLAPFGPHTSPGGKPIYAKRHAGAYAGITAPAAPDLELRPPLAEKLRQVPVKWRQRMLRDRLRSMLSVEEMVARVLQEVDLSETVVMFTSDNGIQLGGRGVRGKNVPYARSTKVPLIVAGPGFGAGQYPNPVSVADILPTVRDLAGARVDGGLDGISLRTQQAGEVGRDAILSAGAGLWPQRRDLVLNLDWTRVTFARGFSVIKWATGPWEAYANDDFYETTNLWPSWDRSTRKRLQASVEALAGCQSGTGCSTQSPTIVISSPTPGTPQRPEMQVRGAAYAPSGRVGAVDVTITRRDDGKSLNRLGVWVRRRVSIPAVVEASDADASYWYVDVDQLPTEGVEIVATMRSEGRAKAVTESNRVTTDARTIADRPALVGAQPRPGLIQGWVLDPDGVANVLVNGKPVDRLGTPSVNDTSGRRAFSIDLSDEPAQRLVVVVRDTFGRETRVAVHRGNRAFPNWAR